MSKNLIGQRIKIARAMMNPPISQADLLARLQLNEMQISQATLSKIETGTRAVSDKELVEIAKALDVDILWLLGKIEKKI